MAEPANRSAETPHRDRPAHIRGPWAIVATLSLFVLVPAFVYVVYGLVKADLDVAPTELRWAQRSSWPAYERQFTSLERGMMSAARTNETYRRLPFDVSAEAEQALRDAVTIAKRHEADFAAPAVGDALRGFVEQHGDLFYGWALLALHRQAIGDDAGADAAFTRAFDLAPAAIKQRVVSRAGEPVGGYGVGTVAIGFDRVREDRLDPTLVLVYPAVQTGRDGAWYLPVYKSIYRLADPAAEPSFTNTEHREAWFTFFGNVGRLPDRTVAGAAEPVNPADAGA